MSSAYTHNDNKSPAQGTMLKEGSHRPAQGTMLNEGSHRPAQDTMLNEGNRRPAQGTMLNEGSHRPAQGTMLNEGNRRPAQGTMLNEGNHRPAQGTMLNEGNRRPAQGTMLNVGNHGSSRAMSGISGCENMQQFAVGGQAVLYICDYHGQKAVVKMYDNMPVKKEKYLLDIYNALKDCHHSAPVLDCGEFDGKWYEIIPYYFRGSLANRRFTEQEIRTWILPQMNEALREIHEKGIYHNDIKPENILIGDQNNLVLIDFGVASFSRIETEEMAKLRTVVTTVRGTTPYMSREARDGHYNSATDYYALGVTVLNLMGAHEPDVHLEPDREYTGANASRLKWMSDAIHELISSLTFEAYGPVQEYRRWDYADVETWLEGGHPPVPNNITSVVPDVTVQLILGGAPQVIPLDMLCGTLGRDWVNGMEYVGRENLSKSLRMAMASRKVRDKQQTAAEKLTERAELAEETFIKISRSSSSREIEVNPDEEVEYAKMLLDMQQALLENGLIRESDICFYWRGSVYTADNVLELGNTLLDRWARGVALEHFCADAAFMKILEQILSQPAAMISSQTAGIKTYVTDVHGEQDTLLSSLKEVKSAGIRAMNQTGRALSIAYGMILLGDHLAEKADEILMALRTSNGKTSTDDTAYIAEAFTKLVQKGLINCPRQYRSADTVVKTFAAAYALNGINEKGQVTPPTLSINKIDLNNPADLKKQLLSFKDDMKGMMDITSALSEMGKNGRVLRPEVQAWLTIHRINSSESR